MRYVNAQGEEAQGVRRKAPRFYIGEVICGRPTVTGDAERWPNGALVGKRDKSARRMIRRAFIKSLSRIEQHILKARDAREEIERLSTNGHEAHRYWDKALALHVAKPNDRTRSQARAKFRPYDNRTAQQESRVEAMAHQREAQEKRDREHALLSKQIRDPMVTYARVTHDGQVTLLTTPTYLKPIE